VIDANVNFAAAKLTVYGQATIEELEQAGAFENLKIVPEKEFHKEQKKELFIRRYWKIFISSLLIAIGYISQTTSGESSMQTILPFLIAIVISGYPLFKSGLNNLFRLEFDMRTLMTIAIIGAAVIGEWSEGAIVVILFAISEALETYSMDKARASIRSLMDLVPKEALVRRNSTERIVPVDEIEIGDIMIVKPGQKIAMDGVVVTGISTVNQAPITGESVPAVKTAGDEVFAGTLNEEGHLEVEVTKHVEDTTIAKIIHLVEEAQAKRAPSQAFVDRFAKYYTPVIMLVALGVAVIPPSLFAADWKEWIYQGLAVLVVGCPCALVISTPVSIVTAIGNAARNGVLIKGGIHLEQLGAIRCIAFDKTGTLTKGVPVVTDYIPLSDRDAKELLMVIAAMEHKSHHPLASAIIKKAEEENLAYKTLAIEEFSAITGKGIQGKFKDETYYIGSPSFLAEILPNGITKQLMGKIVGLQNEGKTVIVAGNLQEVLALVSVADETRENSRQVIEKLHSLGIQKTIMLTGDNKATAKAAGKLVGVSEVLAELLPQDKLMLIKELKNKYERVAMVGDGINDAPALAAANVGIAMGGAGSDTALETADIALMADDLEKLPFAVKLSRKALGIIKQNITFSLGIKLLALFLVVPGWLTLWIAIFADMGATLLVTLNGLRLLRVK
jgi:Cd2+/Zn2+-exporting ATPase